MNIRIAFAFLCFSACSCAGPFDLPYLKSEIALYRGDGDIKDISYFFFGHKVKGYEISFPAFPLNHQTNVAYTLDRLPSLPGCELYFRVEGVNPDANIGHCRISLFDSSNTIVRDMDTYSHRIYLQPEPQHDCILYDNEKYLFAPDTQQTYRVILDFNPSSSNTPGTGALYIRSGGQT